MECVYFGWSDLLLFCFVAGKEYEKGGEIMIFNLIIETWDFYSLGSDLLAYIMDAQV